MIKIRQFFLFVLLITFIFGCQENSSPEVAESSFIAPAWSYNQNIYEVNLRQYSDEGTFDGFEQHLSRLKEMGVGILWFMPIHPIGEEKRKGTLGSYYAVKDYLGVNSEFGTLEEFKQLVQKIHSLGMYVVIDWVANHTAWDNALTVEHPDWYTRDPSGNFVPPVPDWSDVIDLDYSNEELRSYMISAMKFWVEEANIDGFRCDVAEMVPLDFWLAARMELDQLKPVFMLAEGHDPDLHANGFDMTYDWDLFNLMNEVAAGRKSARDLDFWWSHESRYPDSGLRMRFTTNHDENSWNGTVFERLGAGAGVFAVLTTMVPGMPLIYSGQEAGLDKRLAFFERDRIEWKEHEFADLYRQLFLLKRDHAALWNGGHGGSFRRIASNRDAAIFAFLREKGDDEVFVVLNLTQGSIEAEFADAPGGNYIELFSQTETLVEQNFKLTLPPWQYRVYLKQ